MVFISMINIYNFYLTSKKNVYFLFGVESSGKCKISKYFYKTRFWGLKTLVFYAVYH